MRPERRKAFTLIETIIAVALLMLLSAGVLAFVNDLRSQRELLADLGADLEAGSVLLERIDRDLTLSIAYDAEREASGIVGDARSLTIVARRIWPDPSNPTRGLRGTARSTYRFDPETNQLTVDIDGNESVLSDRVEVIRFRYNDSGDPGVWRDAFDAAADGGLPVAIEVAVWFLPPGQGEAGSDAQSDDQPMSQLDAMLAEQRAAAEAEAFADGAGEWPERQPDRWRIFAIPDAEPTGGRAAVDAGGLP